MVRPSILAIRTASSSSQRRGQASIIWATDIFSDMALIAEIHAPKIGLVPVGDRFTMSGRTAALAVKRYFKFETVVPCHYGTFSLLAQDPGDFVAAMQGHATKVAVPSIGEALVF